MLSVLEAICEAEGIILDEYHLGFTDGIAMRVPKDGEGDEVRAIAYDPKLKGWARISTIAHELGHHVLGHLDDGEYRGLKGCGKNRTEVVLRREREAQVFAAAFTAMALFMQYAPEGVAS